MKIFYNKTVKEDHKRPTLPKGTKIEVLTEDGSPIVCRRGLEVPYVIVLIQHGAICSTHEVATTYIDL